jgi:hypothetical protein
MPSVPAIAIAMLLLLATGFASLAAPAPPLWPPTFTMAFFTSPDGVAQQFGLVSYSAPLAMQRIDHMQGGLFVILLPPHFTNKHERKKEKKRKQ